MKFLVINGPNLNMLGVREKNIYGEKSFADLIKLINKSAKEKGVKVKCFQSNYEGAIVSAIQKAYKKFDGIIINPAGYTHTSVAILDALKAVNIPTVEVHITEVNEREEFRKISFVKEFAFETITGKGFEGYLEGINLICDKI